MTELPVMVKIEKITKETSTHSSFYFKSDIDPKPGQFVMVWLPGVEEKPMSISYNKKGLLAITIEKKGNFTKKIFKLKKGDKIGIRGPYGNGFTIAKNSVIIGGGCGAAPVSTLIEKSKGSRVIIGARSKNLLLFRNRHKKAKFTTDDGSFGKKGFVTSVLEEILKDKKKKVSVVQCCGPEIMMTKVFELCQKYKVKCECSLERYMICGFGVCGDCVCGNQLVCKDGPVFNSNQLKKMKEFGKSAKLKSGRKVSLQEYHSTTC